MKNGIIISISMLFIYSHICHADPVDLTIISHEGAGLFAELHKVMQALIHFEHRGIANIYVDWTDEFFPYKNGAHENGWDLFFEQIPTTQTRSSTTEKIIISSGAEFHEMHDQQCTAPWVGYTQYKPYRTFIHEKLTQYIHIKPHITKKVDDFFDAHMHGKICIGVHARIARAHAWLVPGKRLPTIDSYFQEIDKLIEKHGQNNIVIFVASDSHQAVEQFKDRYGHRAVWIDAYRAVTDKDPCIMYTMGKYMRKHPEVWHKRKHRYSGGESTMLDCLLLAKCDYLIHTTSNLAFFACYFNPDLESIYLPKAVPFRQCRFKDNPNIVNPLLNPV